MKRWLFTTTLLLAVGCGSGGAASSWNGGGAGVEADAEADEIDAAEGDALATDAGQEPPEPSRSTWKAVLMAGDHSIAAFDNARRTMQELLERDGVLDEHVIELSREPREQVDGVRPASVAGLEAAMLELDAGEGDACVTFMTSHGTEEGFLIRGEGYLTPSELDRILEDACGDLPTVVMISACHSGVFIDALAAPNRIVLTAARSDRASFGCSAEATYTHWDACVITSWDSAETWEGLYESLGPCIETKERAEGRTPSLPQAFFGEDVRELRILDR